ncbi:MAG: redoxin domain-containing protein [Tepidisphaeraceae bacterium]
MADMKPQLFAWILVAVAVVLLAPLSLLRAAEVMPLAIGLAAPEFSLPGVDGKTHSLANFKAAKVLVVLFTCNHCPTAQGYEGRIKKMHADYREKGVALVAISPNDPLALRLDELGYTDVSDSFEDMKIRARDQQFDFPYLYDGETQKTSLAYGALATPHVFIFDAERKLRYAGRIDDSEVKEPKSHDARNAIDALLAGKPVAVEKTKVFGCSTKWSDKRADAKRSLEKWDAEPVAIESIDAAGVKDLAANKDSKKYRLINVWATWCGPCVAELPELVEMNRMYRKRPFELITISMDEPDQKSAALEMLKQQKVATKNFLYTGGDKDKLVNALDPKWEGPVPFTALIAPGGEVLYRKTGAIDALEVKRVIADHLGRTYASR